MVAQPPPIHLLTHGEKIKIFMLRSVHFLLARGGIFQAICLLALMSERADREKQPPINPWIIYSHALLYMLTSTGLSSRFLSRLSIFVFSAVQLHSTYLFMTTSALHYQLWLRMRAGIRSTAVAGATLRLLSANEFSTTSALDKIGCSFLGISSAMMGLFSLPFNLAQTDKTAQSHEQLSTFAILDIYCLHWIVGCLFLIIFAAYTFPMLIIVPSKNRITNGDRGADSFLSSLVQFADKTSVLAWICILFTRDVNFNYWKRQGVDYWLLVRFVLDDVTVVISILVGSSLPWLSRVTSEAGKRIKKDE